MLGFVGTHKRHALVLLYWYAMQIKKQALFLRP